MNFEDLSKRSQNVDIENVQQISDALEKGLQL